MKPKNLEFYNEIEGSKPHFIFTQDEIFYVFTEMDGGTRGNFFIIPESEVEETERIIQKKYLGQFHPRELDKYDFETDKEYRIQRIRNICYILVAKRVLEIEKIGREVLFNNISAGFSVLKAKSSYNPFSNNKDKLTKSFGRKSDKNVKSLLENYSGTCPLCKRKVTSNLIKIHLERTCSKR